MKVRVDFVALRKFNDTLAKVIEGRLGLDGKGVHEIDPNELQPATRKLLHGFFTAQLREAAEAHNSAFEIDTNEVANRQKIADAEAGAARLNQYAAQGLENNEHNAMAIRKFLDEHPQINGVVTPGTIDAAISHLGPKGTNVLQWKAKVQPVPVPQPEAVVKLADGSDQLPLDTVPSYHHSKVQLIDLDRRKRAAAKTDRKGWHGASL